jgi:hypothetical protein
MKSAVDNETSGARRGFRWRLTQRRQALWDA